MKTVGIALFTLIAGQVQAGTLIDLPREFATCAGRYSAMMEHAWLMHDPEADEYMRLRSSFVALLEATDTGPGEVSFHRRIDAKFAQAALLQTATFSQKPEVADQARHQIDAHLSFCRQLVLGG